MTAPRPSVLILGAASDIGLAIAREYAKGAHSLILAARSPSRLEADAADLRLRYDVGVRAVEFDVLDAWRGGRFLDALGELPDIVVCVVGLMGNQRTAECDAAAAERIMYTNYVGPALILDDVALRMESRGSGHIVCLSSVAGERGRASNYLYGSAKAGLTAFLSGLRGRLVKKNVRVLTVKPGFVRTRMTAGMKLPPLLTAQPEEVARAVVAAQRKGAEVIYVRPLWRPIMLVIRLIPEAIFKRLKF